MADKASALAEITGNRGGYFTARQALSAGYTYRDQHYHTNRGHWVKVSRGIYRLRYYPQPTHPDLIILTLMSTDRSGAPQAVVSHESALALHDMSDANPAQINLTVPHGFRNRMPAAVVLHRGELSENEIEEHEGYRVTTPLRTILDIAEHRSSWPYLPDAVYDALRQGLVRPSQLMRLETSPLIKDWLLAALEAAEERLQRREIAGCLLREKLSVNS